MKNQMKAVSKVFTYEQLQELTGDRMKPRQFDKVAEEAIHTRYVCGTTGYEHLHSTVGYPLPSQSVLEKRISDMKYEPGILEEKLQLIEDKG